MKISGFTFVRNAIRFDYPVVESILSILPVCGEMVVAVGKSEDDTLQLIRSINSPKIKIIETVWDESLRKGGKVLAVETDKAFQAISNDSDWAFYVQADEVFHENDLLEILEAAKRYKDEQQVEGLLFNHINFYGSYDFIADSRKWVKKEIRLIRNDKSIASYKDAMSFRKNDKKLRVKFVDATIHHYGWVKDPKSQLDKRKAFEKLWHSENEIEKKFEGQDLFDYSKIDSLTKFTGSHPKIMEARIKRQNWKFEFDPTKTMQLSWRLQMLDFIYRKTGILIGGIKNYRLLH